MNDLVHETYHGHSPITPQVYQDRSVVGLVAEEVSTELAARATMERRFNIPDPFHFTLATNYEWFINATVEHSARLAGVGTGSREIHLEEFERNDVDAAVAYYRQEKAAGRWAPSMYEMIFMLQDNPRELIDAIYAIEHDE
jgi:hypothetical protein